MPSNQQPSSFKTLQIIHGALCAGVSLFLAVTIFLNYGHGHTDIQPGDVPMIYIAFGFVVLSPFLSGFLFQSQLSQINFSAPVNKRFMQYQTACIMRYAVLEGGAMFAVVAWFITRNELAAYAAGLLIVFMIISRPVKSKVAALLKVSYPETLD